MCLIIYGTTVLPDDSTMYDCPIGEHYCTKCRKNTPHVLIPSHLWGAIFFIPIIPLGRRLGLCCSVCGHASKSYIKKRKENEILSLVGNRAALKYEPHRTGKEKLDDFQLKYEDFKEKKLPAAREKVSKRATNVAKAIRGDNAAEVDATDNSLSESEEYWALISYAYGKIKQTNIFKLWRREQFDCQFGKCAICGRPMEMRYSQVDHVKPRYRGGTNYAENLTLAHRKCNEDKGAKSGYARPDWIRENKYSEKLDEKVYEITEAVRAEYPVKFPDEWFDAPGEI